MCSLIMDIGKPERRNRKPLSLQCRRPAHGDNHPFLSESRHAGENGSLSRNVFSTGSGPNPSLGSC